MWQLDRERFDRALLDHALDSGAQLFEASSRLATFRRSGTCWEIALPAPTGTVPVRAQYVVDATGRAASLARRMGAKRIFRDCLATVFSFVQSEGPPAPLLIEATASGWWYSLGQASNRTLIALVTDPALVRLSGAARQRVWEKALADAPYTAGRAGSGERRLAVSAVESFRLDHMSGDGWCAIGDAAMSFDPLSSNGVTSAVEQAADAAEVLSGSLHAPDMTAFDARRVALFATYAEQRAAIYRTVHRFSDSPFWQRWRSAAGSPASVPATQVWHEAIVDPLVWPPSVLHQLGESVAS
jgi:flavin-dependent dehydrogenase